MCCKHCCTCDCDDDTIESLSLEEFLDANTHPDSEKLHNFLVFFKNYHNPVVNDKSWYTKERLIELFEELNISI